jgi:hypothetical protein
MQHLWQPEVLLLVRLRLLQRPHRQLLHKQLGGLGYGPNCICAHTLHLLVHQHDALDHACGEAKGRRRRPRSWRCRALLGRLPGLAAWALLLRCCCRRYCCLLCRRRVGNGREKMVT